MKRQTACILLIIIHIISVQYANSQHLSFPNNDKWKTNVMLGIPEDSDNSDDYPIKRDQYVISYNPILNAANWASWHVYSKWYGPHDQVTSFKHDKGLPPEFKRIKHKYYSNSGYEKGHLVASNERSNTHRNNVSTFFYTNAVPQREDLNQGPWKELELQCKALCIKEKKQLFIIAGGIYDSNRKLGNTVSIPSFCYKIIVMLNKDEEVKDIKRSTQVIAVIMPNKIGIKHTAWKSYITTIDNIETATGYDFLSNVPDQIETYLEKRSY